MVGIELAPTCDDVLIWDTPKNKNNIFLLGPMPNSAKLCQTHEAFIVTLNQSDIINMVTTGAGGYRTGAHM